MGRIIAVNSNCYHGYSIEQAIDGIAAAGFRYIELTATKGWTEHVFPDQSFERLWQVKERLAEKGLTPFSMSGHCNLMDTGRIHDFISNIRLAAFFQKLIQPVFVFRILQVAHFHFGRTALCIKNFDQIFHVGSADRYIIANNFLLSRRLAVAVLRILLLLHFLAGSKEGQGKQENRKYQEMFYFLLHFASFRSIFFTL